MNTLIPRYLSVHLCSPSPLSPPRVFLLFLHSVAGDGAPPRRPESRPSPSPPASSSQSFSSSSSSRRHYEEGGKDVKVAVWWDFENCSIPVGVNVFRVAHRIMSALRSTGIKGPVTITAFGDIAQLSRISQEALTSTGVCLTHVPNGGKNSSDKSFMADLVYWVSQNPPPVHFFLISGDKDFANILHRLRMSNYNILLASKDDAPGVLCSAATIMWPWYGLVKGEYISVKHFNHPPDGLYSSWYGHNKAVLDDPFSDMEQAANLQSKESKELMSETKPRTIPKVLANVVRQILYSYPDGMFLPDLRAELKKNNINMDKDFYGYKKFSHLLASMPNVLKIVPHPSLEGQLLVVGTHKRIVDLTTSRFRPVQDVDVSDGDKSGTSGQNGKPLSVTPSNELEPAWDISETPTNQKDIDSESGKQNSIYTEGQDTINEEGQFDRIGRTFSGFQHYNADPSFSSKEDDMEDNSYVSTSKKGKNIAVEIGFEQRKSRLSAGQPAGGSDIISWLDSISHGDSGEAKSFCKPTEKTKFEDKATKLKNNVSDQHSAFAGSVGASELLTKDKTIGSETPTSSPSELLTKDKTIGSETPTSSPDMKQSFFSRIARWWMFWKSDRDQDIISAPHKEVTDDQDNGTYGKSNNDLSKIIHETEPHDAFSKGCFWDALESFLLTSKGSELVIKSRTRGQLVHGLQKDGPSVVKDLSEAQLFELVNLVIVEKKWLEESNSQIFPFKRSLAKNTNAPCLSSLFTGRISKSNTHRQVEQETLDENSGFLRSSSNETLDAKTPQNFVEFKAWFQKACKGLEIVEPEDVQKLFETKLNTKLISSIYGYSNLQSLITACLTNTDYYHEKRRLSPSREEILSNETLDAKTPQNFVEFKVWFQKTYKGLEIVEPEDLQKLFKSKFNTKLISSIYGYSNLQSLIAACLTNIDYHHEKRRLSPGREEILSDCHKLLIELFEEYPEGFNMGIFRPTFMRRYGYVLDFQMLGYPKLASLLQIMPGVRIESALIIPAERFHSGSSWSKQPIIGTLDHTSQDDEGNAINEDSEGENNAEDCAFEELGPVSETVIHEDSTAAQVKDKEVSYQEASLSDEEFSDSEGDNPSESDGLEGKSKSCGEDSSLLQILDSWYGSKEGRANELAQGGKEGGEKERAQAVDGLVDCSKNKSENPVDLKLIDRQKVMRLPKRYCFVSDSRHVDEGKLVESILGSLKKAGDSKLYSSSNIV